MTTTAVKELPILFKGRLVRAILDGRKTQTRRVVKLDAELKARGCTSLEGAWVDPGFGDGQYLHVPGPHETFHRLHSPYGFKGDRLWVRETWQVVYPTGEPNQYSVLQPTGTDPQRHGKVLFHADHAAEKADEPRFPWRPSIFMRRWASRIALEITGVRVERLQQISEEDAVAEGISRGNGILYADEPLSEQLPHLVFKGLWDSINEKRGFGWEKNPWVWVIEFRRAQA